MFLIIYLLILIEDRLIRKGDKAPIASTGKGFSSGPTRRKNKNESESPSRSRSRSEKNKKFKRDDLERSLN